MQKLLHQGWIKDEYRDQLKDIFVHAIRADRALGQLSVASKLSSDWTFISELANRGRGVAADWFKQHGQCIGVRSSLDLHRDLLDTGAALHQ